VDTRPQHLDLAAEGLHHRPARMRVGVLERDVVVRVCLDLREVAQGALGVGHA
jgi:hypothetical protein